VKEVIRSGNSPWDSQVNEVHETLSDKVWRENPEVLSFEQCLESNDPEIQAFAKSLDPAWWLIDLRNPKPGAGFSWGRYGPKTVIRRFGEQRIFAYQKRSLSRRFLDSLY
jgi:hypothetical protein